MLIKFTLSSLLVLVSLGVERIVIAQKCENISEGTGIIFQRAFHVMASGIIGPSPNNRAPYAWALGNCGDLDNFIEDMFAFFELFEVNLDLAKKNPFSILDTPEYNFYPRVVQPNDNIRIVFETFYNYAKYRNTPLLLLSWALTAKSEIRGGQQSLLAGHLAYYGMFRFKTHGRDFCVLYQSKDAYASPTSPGSLPVNIQLYNKYWGNGVALGLSLVSPNGTYDTTYTLTFPFIP